MLSALLLLVRRLPGAATDALVLHLNDCTPGVVLVRRKHVNEWHVAAERNGVAASPEDLGSDEILPGPPDLIALDSGRIPRPVARHQRSPSRFGSGTMICLTGSPMASSGLSRTFVAASPDEGGVRPLWCRQIAWSSTRGSTPISLAAHSTASAATSAVTGRLRASPMN